MTFEFDFPPLPEQQEELASAPAHSEVQEAVSKAVVPSKEIFSYLRNREEIEDRFCLPAQPTLLNTESFQYTCFE